MMRNLMLAGAALVMASTVQAREPSEIGCVPKSYTGQERAEIDKLLPSVDFLNGDENDAAIGAFSTIVFESVKRCAAQFKWSEAEMEPAMMHEFGRFIELRLRRHGPFKADQIAKIDATLADGDQTELWAALEDLFGTGVSGEDIDSDARSAMALDDFMAKTGLAYDDNGAEQVGVYLAAKVMQRSSARTFAALK